MRLQNIVCGGVLALVWNAVPAFAGLLSDPDPDWTEHEYQIPAPPRAAALREFFVSSASPNRFLIDEDSVTVGEDGVVRYILVIRTPGGTANATFEGIRCATGAWRIYASARTGGEWSLARDVAWQPIVNTPYNRARAALAGDHFCDGTVPPRNRDDVVRSLRTPTAGLSPNGQ